MELLNKACSTCSAYDIGSMLHVSQDSIAHAGYSRMHPPGQGIDDVTARPADAQITYDITYRYLLYISVVCDEISE